MYFFVDWKQTNTGSMPALPENIGFLLLAQPDGEGTYGIFDRAVSKQEASVLRIQPVSEDLEDLLGSAEQYPPALALARDKAGELSGMTRAAFGEALASYLRAYLVGQRTSPFFLAKAKRTQTGYKHAGGFYWIVGYRPERVRREIAWVSRDFHVYQDALADFDCDKALLGERFPAARG